MDDDNNSRQQQEKEKDAHGLQQYGDVSQERKERMQHIVKVAIDAEKSPSELENSIYEKMFCE